MGNKRTTAKKAKTHFAISGSVIKGETDHNFYISQATSRERSRPRHSSYGLALTPCYNFDNPKKNRDKSHKDIISPLAYTLNKA